ncbi:unnamed protein product [Albugo candida]|uniref:Uncharacterized protein n=1 Tax=Albugo candida TaxID=65357 RepID=A0A024GLI6_9STRA|nr:unnamed protein product [Albugo candida]|eukprot:CCI47365.1 unnamed protein product [Albugo candida]
MSESVVDIAVKVSFVAEEEPPEVFLAIIEQRYSIDVIHNLLLLENIEPNASHVPFVQPYNWIEAHCLYIMFVSEAHLPLRFNVRDVNIYRSFGHHMPSIDLCLDQNY